MAGKGLRGKGVFVECAQREERGEGDWAMEEKGVLVERIYVYRGFPTRMLYLYYISLYTILVGNPRYVGR